MGLLNWLQSGRPLGKPRPPRHPMRDFYREHFSPIRAAELDHIEREEDEIRHRDRKLESYGGSDD